MTVASDTAVILPNIACLRAADPKAIGDALILPGVLAAVERAIVAVVGLVQHADSSMLFLTSAVERASTDGRAVTDAAIVEALDNITSAARLATHHAEMMMQRAIISPARRAGLDVKGFGV